MDHVSPENRQNVIAVANQKGGVGKTTTTVTVAGLLAERGYNTLMIDLDPHGSLTSYFGFDPESLTQGVYNLYQQAAAKQALMPDAAIQPTEFERLSILPASTALATLEKQMGGKSGMGLVLSGALGALKQHYDYVLIDCPPMLGMLMINALAACEQLVIPVQTEFLAIKGLQRMLRTLKMIERSLKKQLAYHVLPTLYDKRTLASKQCLEQLQQDYAEHVTAEVIPVDTKFRDASHLGKPASMLAPNTHGVQAYARFLSELNVNAMPAETEAFERQVSC
ncbi:MAG TPA: ParA family protein [Thiotrichales bacterium]|nr:ParA family protein [Thiotrichales bacterium]